MFVSIEAALLTPELTLIILLEVLRFLVSKRRKDNKRYVSHAHWESKVPKLGYLEMPGLLANCLRACHRDLVAVYRLVKF